MMWDALNRMASCTYAGQTSTFTYGADGLRRRMVTGANTTDYLLDGQSVVREIKNGVIDATYLIGPRGPEYKRDQNGAVSWYLYDGLGSVVGLVDSSGNVTNTRKYDVYGAPRNAQTGSAHCFVGGLGHTSDAETGLIYMRARYMDPATGRFVSEDPKQHGANWYAYANANPVNVIDPNGKEGTMVETGAGSSVAGIMDNICMRFAVYLRDIEKVNQVTSRAALKELAKLGEDPNAWRWVVASTGGAPAGVAGQGWIKAIVCVAGRSAGAFLQMELEAHAIPYGAFYVLL
jgi:RHS repeat-associated protein